MTNCPYCAEEIQQELDVCPFCRSDLVESEDWQPPHEDIGKNAGMRMLFPVGRSGWAIAAGYAGSARMRTPGFMTSIPGSRRVAALMPMIGMQIRVQPPM